MFFKGIKNKRANILTRGDSMYKIVNDFPNQLMLKAKEGPFISLYQPTHRQNPEKSQDVIRFKNLVRQMEEMLEENYPRKEIEPILDIFNRLSEDKEFWKFTYEGLGILYAEGQAIIYKLRRSLKELVVVSQESFYIKPLIRNFQSADRYHVLGLNREGFTIFEGNRYGFDEVELGPDVPTNIKEVLGEDYTDSYITAGSQGIFHGHGSRKEEIKKDTEKFFRFVDRFMLENFSKKYRLPVILVALGEYHTLFRKISHNPYLLEEGIRMNYDILTVDRLKEAVWEIIEPIYLNKTKEVVTRFQEARARFNGSDDLAQIARACAENRVDTIILEADRLIPGRIKLESGTIEEGDKDLLQYGDLLNNMAEIVINNGGNVVILPKERMPSETGAAAIYRF